MAENTKLGKIKEEFREFARSFQVKINDLRAEVERKFENANKALKKWNIYLKTNNVDQMKESVMSIKETITDSLKENYARPRNKVEFLKKKSAEFEISRNTLEQYTRTNNIEFQGMPWPISDER